MSARNVTIWRCDRCTRTATVDERHGQPDGWVRVLITKPPLAHPMEVSPVNRTDRHICRLCHYALDLFMRHPERDEPKAVDASEVTAG